MGLGPCDTTRSPAPHPQARSTPFPPRNDTSWHLDVRMSFQSYFHSKGHTGTRLGSQGRPVAWKQQAVHQGPAGQDTPSPPHPRASQTCEGFQSQKIGPGSQFAVEIRALSQQH